MSAHDLHPTTLEIIADAHHHLTHGGSVNPVRGAMDDLDEVIAEGENVPRAVIDAKAALNSNDPDIDFADELLGEFLRGTDYDPFDESSYHPKHD